MSKTKMMLLAALLTAAPVLAMNESQPDGWLTAKSKLTLLTKGELKASQIHVDANDGVVTLYGKVKDQAQKQAAEATVRGIKGVRGVRNLLQIVPAAMEKQIARTDEDVKDQAEKMLKEDPALSDSSVVVKSVDRGVVLLSGKVKTFSDQLRAVSDVDQIAGVRRVVSEIEGPSTYGWTERNLTFDKEPKTIKRNSMTDTRITAAVKLKLIGAGDITSTDINVDTTDGVVTLFGVVPNDLIKGKAETEATKIDGVTRVQNQLEVVPKSKQKFVEAADDSIGRNLKERYGNNPDYENVSFDVKAGIVRLTGTVPSAWEKLEVMRIARLTRGVKGLHDGIEIVPREASDAPKRF